MSRSVPRVDFDYFIAPDGLVYSFDDAGGRFLESFTGEGMPPIEYRTDRGPFQDGETVIDWVLRPRVIQYVHRRGSDSRHGYWDARADLLNHLRPNRQLTIGAREPGRLRKVLATGQIRDIYVLVESGPVFQPRDPGVMDEFGFTETIRFIAYDPVFFDPEARTEVYALMAFEHLVFPVRLVDGDPLDVDMLFSPSVVNDVVPITYLGTWLSLPTIEITGPAQNPIIRNLTTGEKIELTYNVPAGRVVTIDLSYGMKTVVDDLGNNLIGTVTLDSDLATFHLAPEPEAPGGVNQIGVFFAGASLASAVVLTWFERYIGV